MNPELKTSDYPDASTPELAEAEDRADFDVQPTSPGPLLLRPQANETSNDQWKQVGQQVSYYLAQLPELVSEFFGTYQRPLITLGLLFAGIVSVKLTLAILDAVNDIPLLAPTFELIGIAYSAWFVYRYMLKAETRQELSQEVESLKQQVVGSQK